MSHVRRFFLLLTAGMLLTALVFGQEEEERPLVSVLPFTPEGVSESDANTITRLFEAALSDTRSFDIVEASEREQIISAQTESLESCTDDACAIDIGRLLSAQNIFFGTVSTLGTKYIITVKLVDVERGNNIGTKYIDVNTLEELPAKMHNLARQFAPSGGGGGGGGSGSLVFEDEPSSSSGGREPQSRETDAKATVIFSSTPQGVRFKLYNLSGDLLFDGKTPKGLPLSLSTYLVEAEDGEGLYFPFSEEFTISQEGRVRYEISMLPNFGGIAIYSEPDGADVLLNGIPVGTTPYTQDRMGAGQYEFVVQKNLYESERVQLRVEAGKTARATAVLEPSYVTLKISAIDDVQAKVYIDGQYKGAMPYQGTLPFRDFEIRAVPEDSRYHEFTDVVTVMTRGEVITREIRFGGKYGNIWVDTSPFVEGRVTIDGKEKGVSPDQFTLLEGRHTITVRGMLGQNLLSGTQEVLVREGQDKTITVTMVQDIYQDFVKQTMARLDELEELTGGGSEVTENHVAEVRMMRAEIDSMPVAMSDLSSRAAVLEEDLTAAYSAAYLTQKIAKAQRDISYYESKIKEVKKSRRGKITGGLFSFIGALAAGGGAGYSWYEADQAAMRYDNALLTSEAQELRNRVELFDILTITGASVGGVLGILTPIIWGNLPDKGDAEKQLSNARFELARLTAMRASGGMEDALLQEVHAKIDAAFEKGPQPAEDSKVTSSPAETSTSVTMVAVVPPGRPAEFTMGADDIGGKAKSHRVILTRPFEMAAYEVTFKEYAEFCRSDGRTAPDDGGNSSRPVNKVSWHDAVDYCNWLSEQDGFTPCYSRRGDLVLCNFEADGYRLPTEAEWEFAARGGFNSRGYTYSGGNTLADVAWCKDNAGEKTHPVGQRQPNELGLYDMSGNVWEWVWDWYSDDYFASSPLRDPLGPVEGEQKVEKGGSWFPDPIYMRPQNRADYEPDKGNTDIGFRLARTTGGLR